MHLAVSGHRGLSESTEAWIAGELRRTIQTKGLMLERADELIAVWDGQPARGYGGTADVVQAARDKDLPVTVVWPAGVMRD